MADRENFYILLELNTNPPEKDLKIIEKAIKTKQAQWSRLRNHPSKGRIAQRNLSLLREIKKVMLNEENRKKEEINLLKVIKEEQDDKKEELENIIAMLCAKGVIYNSEIEKLNTYFSSFRVEDIKKMVNVPIKNGESIDLKISNIDIDLESLDYLKTNKIKQNLNLLGKKDLYDFLEIRKNDSCLSIQKKVKKMYIENNKLASKGAETTASSELLGLCVNIFENEQEKKLYDNFIIKENLNKLLQFLEIASVNKFIESKEYLYILEESNNLLIPKNLFDKYINKYCQIKKCKLILPKESEKLEKKKTSDEYSGEIYSLVRNQRTRELEKLLGKNKNLNVDKENEKGDTPLILASYLANIKIIKLLLEYGANVDKAGHNNMTALSWACTKDNVEILRILLSKTRKINHKDSYGFTPLMWAASNGFSNLVKLLLEYNADIKIKNKENLDAAELARRAGFLKLFYTINDYRKNLVNDKEIFEKIKENDVLFFTRISKNNMFLENNDKEYPLEYAIKLKRREIINKIINSRLVDLNKKTPKGKTYVICAIEQKDLVTLSKLYDKGADIELSDNDGYSPLIHAVTNGDMAIIEYLISKKVDLEYCDNFGNRAVTFAVWQNKINIVEFLYKNRANFNIKNNKNKSLLDLAKEKNHTDIIYFLKNKLEIFEDTNKKIDSENITINQEKENINQEKISKKERKKEKKKPWWKFW